MWEKKSKRIRGKKQKRRDIEGKKKKSTGKWRWEIWKKERQK